MSPAATPFVPAHVWLAPMSGATDAPFRRQATKFGAPAVVSEMVASQSLLDQRPDVVRRMCRHEGAGLWIVQLAARRPEDMRFGASLLADAGVDLIDINMGCPTKQVTGGQSGSALMRDLDLASRIIDAALEGAGGRPVTLKMRLGWDHDSLNAPELARRAEEQGVVMMTVHGRTRAMFYKGTADWGAIAETVKATARPVIANGDIGCVTTAKAALEASGAHGVMVGRAAMGQPWRVGMVAAGLAGEAFAVPSLHQQCESLCEQIDDSAELYGERLGVRTVRKHVSAAIDGAMLDLTPAARRKARADLCQIDKPAVLISALRRLYASHAEVLAA